MSAVGLVLYLFCTNVAISRVTKRYSFGKYTHIDLALRRRRRGIPAILFVRNWTTCVIQFEMILNKDSPHVLEQAKLHSVHNHADERWIYHS